LLRLAGNGPPDHDRRVGLRPEGYRPPLLLGVDQQYGIHRHHPDWPSGRLEIAARGGADRRSGKNAAASVNQSHEAHLAARPHHSPEGAICQALDTRRSRSTPSEGGSESWPHPYHGSAAKRRANPRLRSSRDTVSAIVMGPVWASRAVPGQDLNLQSAAKLGSVIAPSAWPDERGSRRSGREFGPARHPRAGLVLAQTRIEQFKLCGLAHTQQEALQDRALR
jgi:hypothetical protein